MPNLIKKSWTVSIAKVLLSNLYTVQESLEVKRVKRRGRQFPTQIPTNFSYFEFHHYSF